MPPLQNAPSWNGPNLGVGNWGGWTNMGTVSGDLMDYTGIQPLYRTANNERVSVHQQYTTSIAPTRPVAGLDAVFNITDSAAAGTSAAARFSICARNIGDINAILAGADSDAVSEELRQQCKTSSQVLDRFKLMGVAKHFMNQKGPVSVYGKTQGNLLICTHGQEYIFNYWEYFHWSEYLDDPQIGDELRKDILRPDQITTHARLWFVLVKMPRFKRTVYKNGTNRVRDAVGQQLIENDQANEEVWQFVPIATRGNVVPRILYEHKEWVGEAIYVGSVMYRQDGNIARNPNQGARAMSAFALLFPVPASEPSGRATVSSSHTEAIVDSDQSRLNGYPIRHFGGIPTLYVIMQTPTMSF